MKRDQNIVAIIQARTDSKRFPRKVLAKIKGKPLLWHVINRVKKIRCSKIVIATTRRKIDDEIIKIAKNSGVEYFRGKKNDVLDRYFNAALKFNAGIIVRITADCPLIDPKISNQTVKKFLSGNYDYITTDEKTYPKGLDVECFSFKSLKTAWKKAKSQYEREHVSPYIYKNPKMFKIGFLYNTNKNAINQRWVVDYKKDLIFIRKIYSKLYKKNKIFLMNETINLLKNEDFKI